MKTALIVLGLILGSWVVLIFAALVVYFAVASLGAATYQSVLNSYGG